MTTINAKYASTCPACRQPITVGQSIEWTRGQPALHALCASQAGAAPEALVAHDAMIEGRSEASTIAAQVPVVTRTLTVTREGRRSYIGGDTMAVRGLLRDGGCHWDADRKQWWIGSQETALALVESAKTARAEAQPRKRITHCVGCGCALDSYRIQRGYRTCSQDCRDDMRMGGQSGYVNGRWHQGSDD